MEGLAPPHKCLLSIKHQMEGGASLSSAIQLYLGVARDDFATEVARWFMLWEQGRDPQVVLSNQKSAHRRALLEIMTGGLNGYPIHQRLVELEEDISRASRLELDRVLADLPFRTMLPLLLLQFPALLLLLLGPILSALFRSLE